MSSKGDIPNSFGHLARSSDESARIHRGVFSREGEFWTIGYDGAVFRLKHSKGLNYVAHLLHFPGTEFHALDLVRGTGGVDDDAGSASSSLPHGTDELASMAIHVGGLGDAGAMLDDQAKAAYRKRLRELSEELDEARERGDVERAERAEREIDALRAELSRAVGLGGRDRRAASASERARQSVTHAIKSVLERVRENHAALGDLLSRCLKTGTLCAYYPFEVHVAWEFGPPAAPPATGVILPSREHEIATLAAPSVGPTANLGLPATNRTRFVGRETEFERLRQIAERALAGNGSVALLSGGPGVGKTRLSLELAGYALERGFVCFRGRCYERDEPHPLMPFVEIIEAALSQAPSVEYFGRMMGGEAAQLAQIAPRLRRVFPDLPPLELSPAQVRRYLFQGFFDFVARLSQTKPVLLVLDDIHWADESTLALINFLANRLAQVPVMVLATYRDGELDTTAVLARTLEELLKLDVRPIRLHGLARSAVAQMLNSLCRQTPPEELVNLIFDETQGNPFFVEEVFTYLVEEGRIFEGDGKFRTHLERDELLVPDNVRLVLSRRLSRLSENGNRVLCAASVIGRSFSFRLLESVLDRTDPEDLFEGVEEAQHMGLVTSSAEGPEAPLAFCHELVRQTLLTSLTPPRRQRLHLKIAEAMEKVDGARSADRVAEIAHHLVKSGAFAGADRVSHYLGLAGQAALRTGAYENARANFVEALGHRQTSPATRAELLSQLASAERSLGNWSAAMAHMRDSLDLYVEMGDRRMIGRIVFDMVEALIWTGRFEEAAEIAQRNLIRLSDDESVYRARLLAALGLIYAVRGEFSPAMHAFDEALASPAVTPFRARVLAYRSVCDFYFLHVRDALENSRTSVKLSSANATWTRAIALSRAMLSLYHLGEVDEAARIGAELEPLAKEAGQLAALSYCSLAQSWIQFGRQPKLSVLDQRIAEILATNRAARTPLFVSVSLAQMSLVRFLDGDWDGAQSLAEEARSAELPGVFDGLGAAMQLRAAAYNGDRARALELLEQTKSRLPQPNTPNTIGAWALLTGAIESLMIIGESHRAAQLYPLTQELLNSGVVFFLFGCRLSQTIAGMAASAGGQWQVADNHFRIAMQQAKDLPHRLEEAEVRRFYGAILLKRDSPDDRRRAREMLAQAVETYDRIGMPRHRDLARALLRPPEH